MENDNIMLKKDSDWSIVDGEILHVVNFIPLGVIKNGKVLTMDKFTPYASIVFECKKYCYNITGYITHKMDFMHLWVAFKERTVKEDEEVIIFWSKKHYKVFAKIFSSFMPRLWVMICQKGAFKLMVDSTYRPELAGEARCLATIPIVEWKPDVME